MNVEELNRLAHSWEDQALACDEVRLHGLGDESECLALLNRSKVYEHCAKSLRSVVASIEKNSSSSHFLNEVKTSRRKPR